jgi:transposase-like protein
MSVLSRPEFQNEEAAFAYVQARIWANGRVCPHCNVADKSGKLAGKSTRIGVYKCYACRKPFTVKIGTIFEASHVQMHLWLQAIYLMCASKKGISSNQLHRTLGVTLKTAWFMSHRIREAMRDGNPRAFGMGGDTVEVDETFIGNAVPKKARARGGHHKNKVLSLVDRSTGAAKSFVVPDLKKKPLCQSCARTSFVKRNS